MGNLELGFDRPGQLCWLLLIAVFWVISHRRVVWREGTSRWIPFSLRAAVVGLLVLALAEMQVRRTADRTTVIFVLDQSESIPSGKRQLMREFAVRSVAAHRQAARGDRAGVVVFGHEAVIEVPPYDDDLPDTGSLEPYLFRRDTTNLEAALKLAQAAFPEDTARRIVLITDGNENVGGVRMVAPSLGSNGIGIDVIPVRLERSGEVAVESVALPADLRLGAPFEVRVVLNNFGEQPSSSSGGTLRGTLQLTRRTRGREEPIGEDAVELSPGKTVVSFRHQIDEPGLFTYQAVFMPASPADDAIAQNNQASAYTHVRGRGRVLVIEDRDHPGEFGFLVFRLRTMGLEVDVQSSDQLFTSLQELQAYDCVVLANVPRSSGYDSASLSHFRDEQITMLVRNTEHGGAGLVMLGGPHSFGAGGWTNTELERAMPVDFQIKNEQAEAVGALVLLMHASEMTAGNHWQKVIAREAIKALGPRDYCGLIHWDNLAQEKWLWGGNEGLVPIAERREQMLALLNRMAPGDMPEFEPSMQLALAAFERVAASARHMIVISDGDPSPPLDATIGAYARAGVKITTVAVGTHGPAGSTPLQNIAEATGGQYYVVEDPESLPSIYQREARRVSETLVLDLPDVRPEVVYPHEILQGIDGRLPPLQGMVLTTVKESPLVEVAVRSPVPEDPRNATILAAWTYGLGRTAVVTTDGGHRWATAWTAWEGYDRFYGQLIRWAMRSSDERGEYTVATNLRDGRVRVVVTALDHNQEFRNFLSMSGVAVGPQLSPLSFPVRQVGAGRYAGEFAADQAGSYYLTIVPHPGEPPILAGVNVPYSAEFRKLDTNYGLLRELASARPVGGGPGVLADVELAAEHLDTLLTLDPFRPGLPPAVSVRDLWPPLVVAAAVVFLGDVSIRRVLLTGGGLLSALAWLRRRRQSPSAGTPLETRLESLRQKKGEFADRIERQRAATRFTPVPERVDDSSMRPDIRPPTGVPLSAPPAPPDMPPTDTDTGVEGTTDLETHTARLLEAKRKAQERQLRRGGDPGS